MGTRNAMSTLLSEFILIVFAVKKVVLLSNQCLLTKQSKTKDCCEYMLIIF